MIFDLAEKQLQARKARKATKLPDHYGNISWKTEMPSFAVVPFVIAVIAALAGFVPAQRAARLDPMEALRYE